MHKKGNQMIPDAAVDAALSALGEAYGKDAYCRERQYVMTALEAAAPHLRSISAAEIEAVEVMIKTAKANGWNEGYAAGMALQVPEPGA